MRKVNPVTIGAGELRTGDVMVVKVVLHFFEPCGNDNGRYRIYRCAEDAEEVDGVPQGSRIGPELERGVCRGLFPVVSEYRGASPDTW